MNDMKKPDPLPCDERECTRCDNTTTVGRGGLLLADTKNMWVCGQCTEEGPHAVWRGMERIKR